MAETRVVGYTVDCRTAYKVVCQMENNTQSAPEHERLRALPWVLANGALNAVFAYWSFAGSVFLFFLSELGLPKGQIGAVLALFPFCGVLALGFAPLATRWGWKRVYLAGYGLRKVVWALLLLLPWVLACAGRGASLTFLFAVIAVFALLRAMAETAYYPWSQEFIPNRVRGNFNGISLVLGTLTSTVALFVAGRVIGQGSGLPRYLVLMAAGCVLGLLSVIMMAKVPGGAPRPDAAAPGVHFTNMLQALRDRNFVTYLGGMGCATVGTMLLTSFLPLYVKERMGVAPGTVVMLDMAVVIGGAPSGLVLGWAADRVGSRPVLLPAMAMSLLVPLGWLLLPRHVPHAVAWCVALYFIYGVASSGMAIGAGRWLFNAVIPPERSTAYTAIYYAWIGVTGGVAPLLAGALLSAGGGWQARVGAVVMDGYSLLFFIALVLLAAGWGMYRRVRPDDRYTTRTVMKRLPPALWRLLFPS